MLQLCVHEADHPRHRRIDCRNAGRELRLCADTENGNKSEAREVVADNDKSATAPIDDDDDQHHHHSAAGDDAHHLCGGPPPLSRGPPTTTTLPRTTTTPPPLVASCADPSFSTNDAQGTNNTDPEDGFQYWWVNNDAWSGSHGPQSINACNQSSWYATSNQPNIGGQVETYPDTEYDVGGRNNPSTTPISGWHSITSTFSEAFPAAGGWDAAYDLWLNNWSTEIMIWNQWAGSQSFWPAQANGPGGFALTLDGVPYHFFDNGGELMFFRDAQVTSGSVDILAALQWLVANPNADNGLVKASDVPTQLEYGVEVSYTSGTETFPMTGLTFNVG